MTDTKPIRRIAIIGTGVIGGMLTATFLATFMIPMLFVVVTSKLGKAKRPAGAAPTRSARCRRSTDVPHGLP